MYYVAGGTILQWNTEIKLKIIDIGIDVVEHMKELELEELIGFFNGASTI